jgi:hypothetical protein
MRAALGGCSHARNRLLTFLAVPRVQGIHEKNSSSFISSEKSTNTLEQLAIRHEGYTPFERTRDRPGTIRTGGVRARVESASYFYSGSNQGSYADFGDTLTFFMFWHIFGNAGSRLREQEFRIERR